MTRLEAIRMVRAGKTIIQVFEKGNGGFGSDLEVDLNYQKDCTGFSSRHVPQHKTIGPIHVRFWAGSWPDWIHATPKQLLGFIKRNYPR